MPLFVCSGDLARSLFDAVFSGMSLYVIVYYNYCWSLYAIFYCLSSYVVVSSVYV